MPRLLPNNAVQIAAAAALGKEHDEMTLRTAYEQLKPTERIFVDVYVATDSPMKAIAAATPSVASRPDVARVRAVDMLKRPLVSAAIADKVRQITSRYEVTAERIVAELAKIGFANMGDYVRLTPDGEPMVDLSNVDRDQMAAIKSVQVEDYKEGRGEDSRDVRRVKFELHDKLSGLDKLAKKLGIYAPAGVQLTGPGGGPVQMVAITADMSPEQAADYYQQTLEME